MRNAPDLLENAIYRVGPLLFIARGATLLRVDEDGEQRPPRQGAFAGFGWTPRSWALLRHSEDASHLEQVGHVTMAKDALQMVAASAEELRHEQQFGDLLDGF